MFVERHESAGTETLAQPPATLDLPTKTLEVGAAEASSEPGCEDIFVPGEILADRFRVEQFLGQGGMGQVFEAFDLELGVAVAVKAIRPEQGRNPSAVKRFKQEVHLARQVTHGNVCRIFDLFMHHRKSTWGRAGEPILFLTMELLSGESLSAFLRRRGPLSASEALPLARDMAAALDAAHEAGVVHQDFKSGNVLLVDEGGRLRAVVTDFGLARTPDDRGAGSSRRAGTPAYMAPELWRGDPVTTAVDIYSFGVVLCEMLTGSRPSSSGSVNSDSKALPKMEALARVEAAPWLPVLDLCLDDDPEKRFPRAGDAVARLGGAGRRNGLWVSALLLATLGAAGLWAAGLQQPSVEPALLGHPGAMSRTSVVTGGELPVTRNDTSQAERLLAQARERLHVFDELGARDLLRQAVALDRDAVQARSLLAGLLMDLATYSEARELAWEAWELADGLPESRRLEIEATYRMTIREGDRAMQIYQRLWEERPDRLDLGLALAWAQFAAGHHSEGNRTLESLRTMKSVFESAGDPYAEARIELLAVRGALEVSGFEDARNAASRVTSIGRWMESSVVTARGLLWLAEADWRQGRLDDASESAHAAQKILIGLGRPGDTAKLLRLRGNIALSRQDTETAAFFYRKLITGSRRLGFDRLTFTGMHNLGVVYSDLGQLEDSRRVFSHFLSHARRRGIERSRIMALLNLASVARNQGDFQSAQAYADQGLEMDGFARPLERTLLDFIQGGVSLDQGDLERSESVWQRCLRSYQDLGTRLHLGMTQGALGDISRIRGDLRGARGRYQSALRIAQDAGHHGMFWRLQLAGLDLEEGRLDEAEDAVETLLAEGPALHAPLTRIASWVLLGQVRLQQGDPKAARQAYEKARELAGPAPERVRTRLGLALLGVQIAGLEDVSTAVAAAEQVVSDSMSNGPVEVRFEARRILGELEMSAGLQGPGRGAERLAALAKEAENMGFQLQARKIMEKI